MNGPGWALLEGSNGATSWLCAFAIHGSNRDCISAPSHPLSAVTYDECRLFSRKKKWSRIQGDKIGPGDQGVAGVLCNLKLDSSEALRGHTS